MAAYFALLEPGDTVMGMPLDQGGHLTHGTKVNFSGQLYNFVGYGLDEDGMLDYDAMAALASEHKPKLIVAGATAYPRIIDFEAFRAAPTTSARCSWSTRRTSRASSPGVRTRRRCRSPMS